MQLAKYFTATGGKAVGIVDGDHLLPLALNQQYHTLAAILEADNPAELTDSLRDTSAEPLDLTETTLLPPIDQQEVWAAGVTYQRSKKARMEESEAAADCYDRVYAADRPELFFKASPHRVRGHGQPLHIRNDSQWNVPEPELALALNTRLQIVGYTIGNDMSSRDIEGDNPLYLPQAKVYSACCGIGPWVTLPEEMPPADQIGIRLAVRRNAALAFEGETSIARMARSFEDLVAWLGRDNDFPHGAFLLTGTGIVPDSGFSLESGDEVEITIDGIGTLSNPVIRAEDS